MRIIQRDIIKRTRFFSKKSNLSYRLLIGGVMSLFLFSCAAPKSLTYFKDVPDTLQTKVVELSKYNTPVIQPDDILQVTVQTMDPGATALLNQTGQPSWPLTGSGGGGSSSSASLQQGIEGYLVDKNGFVVVPLLGKIEVKGKTTDEVRDTIRAKAAEYYKDPVVNVRFANFRVTVLGEVTKPATYVMPNERVTLLDALGAAGDLTAYGKRENVIVIREVNGKKEFTRFNLQNSSMFNSPYFYLQSGDVVYVEPNKAKIASTDIAQTRRWTIMAPIISLLIVLATRIKF